jgi:hypothetical protein
MRAHIPLLLIAIALLWLPRTWMRRGATVWRIRRHRDTRSTGALDGSSISARREFAKPRNYYDLLRGFAGTLALAGGFGIDAALWADPLAPHSVAMKVVAIQTVILLAAVLIQAVRFERRVAVSAPVFFIAGIVTVLCPIWPVVCGFLIAWLLTPIMPNVGGFLIVQALVTAGLVYFLGGLSLLCLVGIGLCLLPILVSLLTRRPLTVFSRRGATNSRSMP